MLLIVTRRTAGAVRSCRLQHSADAYVCEPALVFSAGGTLADVPSQNLKERDVNQAAIANGTSAVGRCLKPFVLGLCFLFAADVYADTVTPSADVSTHVVVRASASAQSAAVGSLLPGRELELVGSVPVLARSPAAQRIDRLRLKTMDTCHRHGSTAGRATAAAGSNLYPRCR